MRNEIKEIPWRQLYGLRNRIVHDYEGVNLDLVWQIVSDDIPDLIKKSHEPPALLVVGKRIFQYKNLLCYNLRGLATAEKKHRRFCR